MRIVIDMQGAQTGSKHRGIGRYTLSLVEALIKNKKHHEIILMMSSLQENTIFDIKSIFSKQLANQNMKVCYVPGPVYEMDYTNQWSRLAAEKIRENYLLSLEPDFILLTTFFEGFGEDFVCSIGELYNIPTAMIFYDLIPLMNEKEYLSDPYVKAWYMNKIRQCEKAQLLLSISESAKKEALDYLNIEEQNVVNISTSSDSRFHPLKFSEEDKISLQKKFNISKNYLMYSGATDERKNHLRLIEAFTLLPHDIRTKHQLVFVGGMPEEIKLRFLNHAKKHSLTSQELFITGKVSDEEMNLLYNLCTAFVFPSWHEGFGLPALEAMQCGKAVIASNTSSLPEVIGRVDALFDPFDVKDISDKINLVLSDKKFRNSLEIHAKKQAKKFSWDITAQKAIAALENYNHRQTKYDMYSSEQNYTKLIENISKISLPHTEKKLLLSAQCIDINHRRPHLLLDISELVKHDSKTGIQRVVKGILKNFVQNKLHNYAIEPIYIDTLGRHRYAMQYLNKGTVSNEDELVSSSANDIYLCLDLLHPNLLSDNLHLYLEMKDKGMQVIFLIYDILPIQFPQYANIGVPEGHKLWLENIINTATNFICISKSVMNDVKKWMHDNPPRISPSPEITSFHLGADIVNSSPSKGLAQNADKVLIHLKKQLTFLMVGTIEPRKGHTQTLKAFERLWQDGVDVNLVYVGKEGWLVEELVQKMKNYPELNKKFFWLESISDEYLEKVYENSTCLIAASEGEGFGLPLIEAAQKKIPIIARNIPVFKEVAGEYAYYFDNDKNPDIMYTTIKNWIELYKQNKHPKPDNMPWLTWEESTQQLLTCLNIKIDSNIKKETE